MQSLGEVISDFFKSFLYDWGLIKEEVNPPKPKKAAADPKPKPASTAASETEQEVEEVDYSGYWWHCDNIEITEIPVIEDIDKETIYKELQSLVDDDQLPTIEIPQTAIKAIEMLELENFDFIEIAHTISKSPAMAAEFLKVVNSSAYGRETKTQDLKVALPWLGCKNTKAMLYLYSTKITVARNIKLNTLAEEIVDHSYATAVIASYLSQLYFPDHDMAFLAGLLHDVGKLGIIKTISDNFKVKTSAAKLYEEHFGTLFTDLHEHVGAYVAHDWSLDPLILAAIEHHHDFATADLSNLPRMSRDLCAVINLSDTIAKILGKGNQLEPVDIFDLPAAKALFMEKDAPTIAFLEKIPDLVHRACSSE